MSLPEKGPIENKVWAATIGASAGTILSNLILWLLGCWFFGGDWRDASGQTAVNAVPDFPAAAVVAVVAVGMTFLGGYLAKHTPRADAQALETVELADRYSDQTLLPDHLSPSVTRREDDARTT